MLTIDQNFLGAEQIHFKKVNQGGTGRSWKMGSVSGSRVEESGILHTG